jgi:hypothetical protein
MHNIRGTGGAVSLQLLLTDLISINKNNSLLLLPVYNQYLLQKHAGWMTNLYEKANTERWKVFWHAL